MVRWVLLLLVGGAFALQGSHQHHAVHPAHKGGSVHNTRSVIHTDARVLDLTQHVIEIPEQTLSLRHRRARDLEEEGTPTHNPTAAVAEIPEQTISDPQTSSQKDLEETGTAEEENARKQTKVKIHNVFPKGIPQDVINLLFSPSIQLANKLTETLDAAIKNEDSAQEDDDEVEVTKAAPQQKRGVRAISHPPKHGKLMASTASTPPGQLVGQNLGKGFRNPLSNRTTDPSEAGSPHTHLMHANDDQREIEFESNNFHFRIHHNHAKNFLDASRVQVGTSYLSSRSSSNEGKVAKYRVRFGASFAKRPIVFVTTVPQGATPAARSGSHPDVFAATVSEIRTDHFVVNVVRVDSLPNNGWGQELYLDWIALEYDEDRVQKTPSYTYLQSQAETERTA